MINFIYRYDHHSLEREVIIKNLCQSIAKIISLPKDINIEIISPYSTNYGETLLDKKFKNTIRINSILGPHELIQVLAHELIHLHQIHIGKLMVMNDGSYIYNNSRYMVDTKIISYKEYSKLPWEMEVKKLLPSILEQAISSKINTT